MRASEAEKTRSSSGVLGKTVVTSTDRHWAPWIAGALAAIAVVVAASAPFAAAWQHGSADLGSRSVEIVSSLLYLAVGPIFGITGALIVSRQPGNTIGWTMMIVSIGFIVGLLVDVFTPSTPPASIGVVAALVLTLGGISWLFFIFPIFHLLLTFPTGRVLSRAWGVLVALEVTMFAFLTIAAPLSMEISDPNGAWSVANPVGILPESFFGGTFQSLWEIGLLILTAGGLFSIVVRFRRSRSMERQQIKGLLFAVGFFALVYGGAAIASGGNDSDLLDLLLPVAMIGIGVAVAVAVLRYRLYDLDRLISRTVSYTIVIGALAAAYLGVVALVGTQVSGQPIFVAAVTLAVAALFNPLRRRVLAWVDRRFNRSKYDAERVMDSFAASLRDRTDIEGLLTGWQDVVVETMQPSLAGVWVRHG